MAKQPVFDKRVSSAIQYYANQANPLRTAGENHFDDTDNAWKAQREVQAAQEAKIAEIAAQQSQQDNEVDSSKVAPEPVQKLNRSGQKVEDSPFVKNLKEEDENIFNSFSDRNKVADKVKTYNQQPTTKSPIDLSASSPVVKQAPKKPDNYGVFQYLKDAWNTTMNSADSTNLDSDRGELVTKLQPKLQETELQLNYLEAAKAFNNQIYSLQSSTNPQDKIKLQNVIAAKNSTLAEMRNKDDFSKEAVRRIYEWDSFKSPAELDKSLGILRENQLREKSLYDEKLKSIKEKQDRINDRDKVSDYFKATEDSTKMDYTSATSWLYKMPQMVGSSVSSIQTSAPLKALQVGLWGAAAALASAESVALAPMSGGASLAASSAAWANFGIQLAGISAGVADNVISRQRETAAEAYTNYKTRVITDAQKQGIDLEKAKATARENIGALGFDKTKPSDEDVLDLMLTTGLQSGDKKFDNMKYNAKKGLDVLINENNMLSASDIAQEILFIPMMGTAIKGATKAMRTVNAIDKAAIAGEKVLNAVKSVPGRMAAKTLETGFAKSVAHGIGDVTEKLVTSLPGKAIQKALYEPMMTANGKTIMKFTKDAVKRGIAGVASEGAEEAVQWQVGQDYAAGKFDDGHTGFFKTAIDFTGNEINGLKTAVGLPTNPALDSNEEYKQSVIGGGMMGLMFGAGMGSAKPAYDMYKQIKTNNYIHNITAENIAAKESMVKANIYADKQLKGQGERVLETLRMMQDNPPEGLTKEDITEEIDRAKITMQYAESPIAKKIAKEAGIKYGSDEYKTMVALATNAYDQRKSEEESNKALVDNIAIAEGNIHQHKGLETVASTLKNAFGLEIPTEILGAMNNSNRRINALTSLIDKLKVQQDTFKGLNETHGFSFNEEKVGDYVSRLEAKLAEAKKAHAAHISELSNSFTTENGEKADITPESIQGLLENIQEVKTDDNVSLHDKLQLKELSDLSYTDAVNRENAYNGAFFDTEHAMLNPAYSINKKGKLEVKENRKGILEVLKGKSKLERTSFAAGLLAKDEVNHYLQGIADDADSMRASVENEATQEMPAVESNVNEPVTHIEEDEVSEIRRKTNAKQEALDAEYKNAEAKLQELKNNPYGTIKGLSKELRKEVSKKGYKNVQRNYERRLEELKTLQETNKQKGILAEADAIEKANKVDENKIARAEEIRNELNKIDNTIYKASGLRNADELTLQGSPMLFDLMNRKNALLKELEEVTGKKQTSDLFGDKSLKLFNVANAIRELEDLHRNKNSEFQYEEVDNVRMDVTPEAKRTEINEKYTPLIAEAENKLDKAKKEYDDIKDDIKQPVTAEEQEKSNDDVPTVAAKPEEPVIEPVSENSKFINSENIDWSKFDFENNYYVIHQTSDESAKSILETGFRTTNGLDGTSVVVTKEVLLQLIQTQREGHGHRLSQSIIVLEVPKNVIPGTGSHILDRIDTYFMDENIASGATGTNMFTVNPKHIKYSIHTDEQIPTETETTTVSTTNTEDTEQPTKKVELVSQTKSAAEIEAEIIANQANYIGRNGEHYQIVEEDGSIHNYSRVTQAISIDPVTGKSLSWEDDYDAAGNVVKSDKSIAASTRALVTGTAVDEIIRDFFQGITPTKPDNFTVAAYNSLCKSLAIIKVTMELRGERFMTNNVVLYGKFTMPDGSLKRIAGEVDILAIDSNGNFRIYDTKTSKYSFEDEIITTKSGKQVVNESHFTKKGGRALRSSKESYTLQLSAYKNLFEHQYGTPVVSLAILPIHTTYTGEDVTGLNRQEGIQIEYTPDVEQYVPSQPLTKLEYPSHVTTPSIIDAKEIDVDLFRTPDEYAYVSASENEDGKDKGYIAETHVLYQGRAKVKDDRHYNYYTLHSGEAVEYSNKNQDGGTIEKVTVNVTGFLEYYGDYNNTAKYLSEFEKIEAEKNGKTNPDGTSKRNFFNIFDNSKEGLARQLRFFKFIENKGFKGIRFFTSAAYNEDGSLNLEYDAPYVVTFGKNGIIEDAQYPTSTSNETDVDKNTDNAQSNSEQTPGTLPKDIEEELTGKQEPDVNSNVTTVGSGQVNTVNTGIETDKDTTTKDNTLSKDSIEQAERIMRFEDMSTAEKNAALESGEITPVDVPNAPGAKAGVMQWYSPISTTSLSIPGIPNLRSGSELHELLRKNPNALQEMDSEIIVNNWNGRFDSNNPATYNEAGIYTVYTDTNGNKYATAFKTPESCSERIKPALEAMRAKIIEIHNNITAQGLQNEQYIKPTNITRSNGLFDNVTTKDGAPVYRPISSVKGFGLSENYEMIGREEDGPKIGIGKGVRYDNTIRDEIGMQLPGIGGSGAIYLYPPTANTSGKQIPIQLRAKPFKSSPNARVIAELVYDLLIKQNNSGKTMATTTVKGRLVDLPFTVEQLASLIVNNGKNTLLSSAESSHFEFLIPKQLCVENGLARFGEHSYPIKDVASDNTLKELFINHIIENQHWAMDKTNIFTSLVDKANDNGKKPNAFFGLAGTDKMEIIPGELEFTLDDFGLMRTEYEVVEAPGKKGLTYLGWYAKNGKLVSDLSDNLFTSPINYVEDVTTATRKATTQPIVPVQPSAVEEPIVKLGTEETSLIDALLSSGSTDIVVSDDEFNGTDNILPQTETGLDSFINDAYGDVFNGDVWKTSKSKVVKKINKRKASQWLIKTLGITPESVVFTDKLIIASKSGMQVWGGMNQDAITLYEGAESGVEYHEAFHRVSLILFDDAQREALYKEYRSKNGKTLTDNEVEEALADAFMDYMNSPVTRIKYFLEDAFNRLMSFIGVLKNYTPSQIREVYKNINRGAYANTEANKASVARFQSIYENVAPYLRKGVEYKTIPTAKDYNNIIGSLRSLLLRENQVETVEDVSKIKADKFVESINKMLTNPAIPEARRAVFKELVEKFDTQILPDIKNSLTEMSIKINEKATDNEMSNMEDGTIKYVDKASYEVNKLDNAPLATKIFVSNIPDAQFKNVEQNGKIVKVLAPIVEPFTGLPVNVDMQIAFNHLLTNLNTCDTFEEVLAKTKELASTKPFFAALYTRLTNERLMTENLKTQFVMTVNSNYQNLTYVKYSYAPIVEGSTRLVSKFGIGDSGIQKTSRLYVGQWNNNFFISNLIDVTDSEVIANESALKEISDSYKEAANIFKAAYDTNTAGADLVIQTKLKVVAALNKLGITIDVNTFDTYIASKNKNMLMTPEKALNHVLNSTFAGSLSHLFSWADGKNDKNSLLYNIAKGNKLTYRENNALKDKRINEVFRAEKAVKELSEAYAKVHPRMDSMSVLGAEGSLLYPVSQNCYASDHANWLNKNSDGIVDALLRVPYSQHSRLLGHLKNGNKIALATYCNFTEESVGDKGRGYLGISDAEDFMSKMTFIANDYMVFPTMADKTTYFTIKGVKLHHLPLEFTKSSTGGMYVKFEQDVINTFYGYMLDELNAIKSYWSESSQQLLKDHPERAVANYHTKGKGGKFRYFGTITTKDSLGRTVIIDLNNDVLDNESLGDINARIAKVEEFLFGYKTSENFNPQLNASNIITNMLQDRYLDDMQTAVKLGLLVKNGVNTYKNIGLDQTRLQALIEHYKENEDTAFDAESFAIRSMISEFSVGTVMSINEFEKVFTGDPAYYKSTDDKIKRVTAVLSTGDHIRVIEGDGKYNCIELKDNEIASVQYEQLLDLFIKANLRDSLIEGGAFGEDTVDIFLEKSEEERAKWLPAYSIIKAKIETDSAADVASYGVNKKGEGRVNQTDATVIIGPRMYKTIVKGLGEWSPEVEAAFDILEGDGAFLNDATLYQASMKTLLKPLKTMSFGDNFDEDLHLDIPIFNKMAMFPLFKVLAKGDSKVLYDRMNKENDTIDMVAFSTAIKVGNRTSGEFYTDSSNTAINDLSAIPVYKQDYKFLRRQLVTNPHHSERQMFGTQVAKASLSNLKLDRNYNGFTGEAIRTEVMGAMNALSTKGLERFLDNVGDTDENGTFAKSMQKISKMLQREAVTAGMSSDVIDGLELVNGKFKVPLSAMPDSKWIASRFISLLNKEAVDINLPGGSFIQKSSFAQKQITTLDSGKAGRGEYLKFHKEDGSMDCEISINLLAHAIPGYSKMSFNEARQYLIDNNIIGENATPMAIGYRIPTQGLSSIVSLNVKEVMPGIVGDTIILPDEFTALTGSDFDVDKLYVARYNYEKTLDEDGNVIGINKVEFADDGTDNKWMNNSREANENRLIDMYMKVLTDKNSVAELKASLDNTTDKLKKGALAEVKATLPVKGFSSFYELSPSYQLNKKHEYTGGKAGIAPFALNNVHHVLTQLFRINYAKNTKGEFKGALNKYGFGNISGVKGRDGLRILDWLSAMINAHVDVAKDPYIIQLNVTQPTYNMTNFLLRNGLGEGTFYFLPQPILKDMVAELEKLNGNYGIDKTKSVSALQNDAMEKVWNMYYEKALEIAMKDGGDVINFLFKGAIPTAASLEKAIAYMTDTLKSDKDTININGQERNKTYILKALQNSKSAIISLQSLSTADEYGLTEAGGQRTFEVPFLKEQLQKYKNQEDSFEYYKNQLEIFDAYKELDIYANELSEMVHICQIDTKKFGNNFALQKRFEYRLKKFMTTTKVFNPTDIKTMFRNSFLDTKFRNSVLSGNELFKDMLITSTDAFNKRIEDMLSAMGQSATKSEDLVNTVSNVIEASVKGKFFDEFLSENADKYASPKDLLFDNKETGTKSIANRFTKLKRDIESGVYPEFVDNEGKCTNEFLNYIQAHPRTSYDTWDTPDTIGRTTTISTDKYLQERLIGYWEELLNCDKHPEIKQFAEDLVNYSFITSGDNTKQNSIFHLVPASYREKIGFNKAIDEALTLMNTGDSYDFNIDDVYENNWHNGKLVPDVILDKGESHLERIESRVFIPGTTIRYPMVIFNKKAYPIGMNKDKKPVFKPYIKVNVDRSKNPRTTLLYKLIGTYEIEGSVDVIRPVYQLVSKKGISQEGMFVVEHNDSDKSLFDFNNVPDIATPSLAPDSDALNDTYAKFNITNAKKIQELVRSIKFLDRFEDNRIADIARDRSYASVMNGVNTEEDELVKSVLQHGINVDEEVEPINIWAGTNENADLSNFAHRPFKYTPEEGDTRIFYSVEQAFQYTKAMFISDEKDKQQAKADILAVAESNSAKIKQVGCRIPLSAKDLQEWNKSRFTIMKNLMGLSFIANPDAMKRLLDTGNAELTHAQDNGVWGKAFPLNLMQLRETFRSGNYTIVKSNTTDRVDTAKLTEDEAAVINNKEDVSEQNVPEEYGLHSGGAYGGDTFFDEYAAKYGIPMQNRKHYNAGSISKTLKERGIKATDTTEENLNDKARALIEKEGISTTDVLEACREITKRYTGVTLENDYKGDLKARNVLQVISSDAVYAVAPVNAYGNGVTGGTNYAVKLAIKLGKPVYVADPSNPTTWLKWDGSKFKPCNVPVLAKDFAGIGSRSIESYWKQGEYTKIPYSDANMTAIRSLVDAMFAKAFKQPNAKPANAEVKDVQVTFNNNDFVVTPDNRIISVNSGKEVYKNEQGGRQDILRLAGKLPANVAAVEAKKVPIISNNGIKKSSGTPNLINVNGRQVDIAEYGVNFKLNNDQVKALNEIDMWANNSHDTDTHTLIGAAGTGKSTITKLVIANINDSNPDAKIALGAYTHDAGKVMTDMTGNAADTIHHILGLAPNYDLDNFDVNDVQFEGMSFGIFGDNETRPDYLIIDECSMVSEALYDALDSICKSFGTKLLFIGDKCQLTPVKEDKISKTFRMEPHCISQLIKVERQTGGNPLLPQLDKVREAQELGSNSNATFTTAYDEFGKGIVSIPMDATLINNALDYVVNVFKSPEYEVNPRKMRVLAYANSDVDGFNNRIRTKLGLGEEIEVGEPIKFYKRTEKFTNSEEGKVLHIEPVVERKLSDILGFMPRKDVALKLKKYEIQGEDVKDTLNVISEEGITDIRAYHNAIAAALNEFRSDIASKAKNARSPKERARLWKEDYYGRMESFDCTFDINFGGRKEKAKTFTRAYATTIHKSQGRTFENVLVYKKGIDSTAASALTKQQLTYVAMSRPTNTAFVISSDANSNPSAINEYVEKMNKLNDEYNSDSMLICKS